MYDGKLPTDYGALGYAGVRTVLTAVKNAGSVDTDKVIAALEAHEIRFLQGTRNIIANATISRCSRYSSSSRSRRTCPTSPTCSTSSAPTRPTKPTCGAARNSVTRPDAVNGACLAGTLRLWGRHGRSELDLIALQMFTGLALGAIYVLFAIGHVADLRHADGGQFRAWRVLHGRRLCRALHPRCSAGNFWICLIAGAARRRACSACWSNAS